MNTKKIAQQIANQLFKNGRGEKAKRLVLELKGGLNGGGWCKSAVVDVIENCLVKAEKKKR